MDIKVAIVTPLETGLRLAFAVIRVRQNDVALFERSVRYVFIQPDDSRLVCNDDTSYSADLLTNRESSDFPPILLPGVINRNDFMRCPLAIRAAFKTGRRSNRK